MSNIKNTLPSQYLCMIWQHHVFLRRSLGTMSILYQINGRPPRSVIISHHFLFSYCIIQHFFQQFPGRTCGHLPVFSRRIDHQNITHWYEAIEPLPGIEGKNGRDRTPHHATSCNIMHYQMNSRTGSSSHFHQSSPQNDRSMQPDTMSLLGIHHIGAPTLGRHVSGSSIDRSHLLFLISFPFDTLNRLWTYTDRMNFPTVNEGRSQHANKGKGRISVQID